MYPNTLLDLYPYCNAKCTFCSYHGRKRAVKPMPDEIWKKVIDEIGASGESIEVMPYYYGESLLNPRIFEVCDYISEHAPNVKICISTNGSRLSPDIIEKLLNVKTLDFLNFSVYAGTKETYEKIMGLDYNTLDKVEDAIMAFQTKKPHVRLCVGVTGDTRFVNQEDANEITRRFGKYHQFGRPIVSPHAISFNNQHGRNTRDPITCPDHKPCQVPFANAVVFCDGVVGVCCFDVEAEMAVGDVTKTTLLEAVYSPLAQKIRQSHLLGIKDVIPLCGSCTQPN